MVPFDTVLAGLGDAFTLTNLLFVIAGVAAGQLVGALPGIGPVMAIAIAIPFTFALAPLPAISFLVGVMKGGLYGGSIPAILVNTPGTPDAAATALDGHPLARKGKPVKATKMALYSSVTGDTFSDIVLITVSAPLAIVALKMGPVEICALLVFAFSVMSGLVGDSVIKGLIAAAFGLLCATVGLDPEHGTPRLYFGYFELFDGLPSDRRRNRHAGRRRNLAAAGGDGRRRFAGDRRAGSAGPRRYPGLLGGILGLPLHHPARRGHRHDTGGDPRHRLHRRGLHELRLGQAGVERARNLRHRQHSRRGGDRSRPTAR